MTLSHQKAHKAVTLAELLVVLAILTLLATMAIPVYVNKAEQARRVVALAECRNIAEAEQACSVIHGYYVPMHTLDNLPDLPPGESSPGSLPRDDWENYPQVTAIYAINTAMSPTDQDGNQFNLEDTDTNDDSVVRMIRNWGGPFLQPQRVYRGEDDEVNLEDMTQQEVSWDLILDPWGRPYRFYSPLGYIGSSQSTQISIPTNNAKTIDDGYLTSNDPRFDRYAIVSFGPDGRSNTNTSIDDDVWYEFGMWSTVNNAGS